MLKKLLTTRLGQNVLTNYIAVVWMGMLTLLLVPVYLRKLGQDQWAIVAICMSIQTFLGLLDAGLGQIMPREMAQAAGDTQKQARHFLIFSRIYLTMAIAGFVLGQIGARWISASWVKADGINVAEIETALRLILVQFLFQFANNAHIGYWNGVERQKRANIRQCAFVSAKHLLALVLVFEWRADAVAYLLPFAAVSAVEWISNRRAILRRIPEEARHQAVDRAEVLHFARQSLGLAVAVMIGMLISQMDRLVLSRTVSLVDYGIYIIVTNLGLALMQLQAPLMRAFFPRIAQHVRNGTGSHATDRTMLLCVIAICVAPCIVVSLFAPQVLEVWTGNAAVVAKGASPLRFIAIAVATNALYGLVYLRMLALGVNRFLLSLNAAILVAYSAVLAVLAPRYGITAGGLGWLFYTGCQFVGGGIFLGLSMQPAEMNRRLNIFRK